MIPSIKLIRNELADYLAGLITGAGLPIHSYNHLTAATEQKSPLMLIGTYDLSIIQEIRTYFLRLQLAVTLLVRFDNQTEAEEAEDYLDDVDTLLVRTLGLPAQQYTNLWRALDIRFSPRDSVEVNGVHYRASSSLITLHVYPTE